MITTTCFSDMTSKVKRKEGAEAEGRNKKRKHLHLRDGTTTTTTTLVTCNEEEIDAMGLLEKLRRKIVVLDHYKGSGVLALKRDLILKHIHEFPSKFQPFITEAKQTADAIFLHLRQSKEEIFERRVFHSASDFFAGQDLVRQKVYKNLSEDEWLGLDSDIDTEDQVELLIRLYPNLLTESRRIWKDPYGNGAYPILNLTRTAKSVSFVPFFAKMGLELDLFFKARGGLCHTYGNQRVNVLHELLSNSSNKHLRHANCGKAALANLDEKCLAVLARLQEDGLVKESDVYSLLFYLLNTGETGSRSMDFFETRLRLLIHWYPTTLMQIHSSSSPFYLDPFPFATASPRLPRHPVLLQELLEFEGYISPPLKLRAFKVLFELGMSYYPEQLGFVFHGSTFGRACRIFGVERVSKMIDDQIVAGLNQNTNTMGLHSLVLAAAADDEISLDGLYTLIRCNPAASISSNSKTTSA